jgi:hypothetical protein
MSLAQHPYAIPLAPAACRLRFVAPAAALAYPFLLMAFHYAAGQAPHDRGAVLVAAASLLASIAVSIVALLSAMRYFALSSPSEADLMARRVALAAVAAPPLYVLVGVATWMAGVPGLDTWLVSALWLGAMAAIAMAGPSRPAPLVASRSRMALIVAHGVAAALFILLYLGLHLGNHLFGLAGADQHTAVMKMLRYFYRSSLGEPLVLGLLFFLLVSGAVLSWSGSRQRADRFRAFQIASGVYLLVAITSHVNAVLNLARVGMKIDTDWAFATGAPAGLIADPWNIRLLPYYLLAVFFAVAHPFSGLRAIMLKHGVEKPLADRTMIGGAVFAALLAILIILAMCGLRLSFV